MQGDLFPWESRDDEIFGIMIFYGSTLPKIRIKQKKHQKTNLQYGMFLGNNQQVILLELFWYVQWTWKEENMWYVICVQVNA